MKRTFRARSESIAISFLVVLSQAMPAGAEGFPKIGDRVVYADSLPYYNLGNRYLAKQWWEKAIETYHKAIAIYPYDADVYTNLGIAFRQLKNFEGAERAYKQATELKADDWICWSNLANLYMLTDRFSESIVCFEKALAAGPPEPDKKAIGENIDGIGKIMKAKGLSEAGKAKSKKVAAPQPKTIKKPMDSKKQSSPTKSAPATADGAKCAPTLDKSAYDSWLSE
ncbi:MAG: tetratricopeptide repeat protein [Candidatus Obscuribacterales bacterium]|nr:tetratricopeptide repeat protein [Candidatus Obscuribacterales bacterium]